MIALRLHEWRKHRRVTMDELAEMIGTSKVTISQIESGRTRSISMDRLGALASALSCGVPDLFQEPPVDPVVRITAPTAVALTPPMNGAIYAAARGAAHGVCDWLASIVVRLLTAGRIA